MSTGELLGSITKPPPQIIARITQWIERGARQKRKQKMQVGSLGSRARLHGNEQTSDGTVP
jgi:hypothetical protein